MCDAKGKVELSSCPTEKAGVVYARSLVPSGTAKEFHELFASSVGNDNKVVKKCTSFLTTSYYFLTLSTISYSHADYSIT